LALSLTFKKNYDNAKFNPCSTTISHPSVGAVILFARNYQDKNQVADLIAQIKAIRTPSLLIAVDQEGGRVQRFQNDFTRLPAAQSFGDYWDEDRQAAPIKAYQSAFSMASELISVGVDFSFAPVFDVTSRESEVIGDRCFHSNPSVATELLGAYIDGMHAAGMVSIAKHFPGHGGVSGDSHHCLPQDERSFDEICGHDQKVLRERLGFSGVIFSDDLTMQGAIDANESAGSIVESAQRAIYAGCDMVLVCNKPDVADQLLEGLEFEPNETLSAKLLNRLRF